MYIHELKGWPDFTWNRELLASPLAEVRHHQGRLIGHMEALGFGLRQEAELRTLTTDVIKTSEIEGEHLDADQVRSSIALHLGIDIGALTPADRHVDGIVDMILDATVGHREPLTEERLFEWHRLLFPDEHSGMRRIRTGAWRTEEMQIVSGPIGNERVHYEAPGPKRVAADMKAFLKWFNASAEEHGVDLIARAALAHLWFVMIHPFDDGNGRIARAIADMALARSENSSQRFYSMSSQIRKERADYYRILQYTQGASMDITRWMTWFIGCLDRAIEDARNTLASVMRRARFWERAQGIPLSDRQTRAIAKLLDGFEGKLTTSKYAKLADCSEDTALRDISYLAGRGILVRGSERGRSTNYTLAET